MVIFKEIQRAIRVTTNNIKMMNDSPELMEVELKKLSALKEIVEYINSLNWLSHKNTKARVRAFLKSNFNYSLVAEEFGTSLNAMQTSISRAASILESKIGKDTIKLIMNGDVDSALTQFRVGVGRIKVDDMFIENLVEGLPDAKYNVQYSVLDCKNELSFLKYFTVNNINAIINAQDKSKLSFLRYIIESNDSRFAEERDLVYKFLSNKDFSIGDLMSVLSSLRLS